MAKFRKVFDSPLSRRESACKLLWLHQDSRSVADYPVDFRTLAAESAWNPEALFHMFLHGLSEVVKHELAAREPPMDLDSLIDLNSHLASEESWRPPKSTCLSEPDVTQVLSGITKSCQLASLRVHAPLQG